MGFNYKWFKAMGRTLANQRVFNRYFKKGWEDGAYKDDKVNFIGLEFTQKLGDYIRYSILQGRFLKQRERFWPVFALNNNKLFILLTFMPIFMGGGFSVMRLCRCNRFNL